MMISFTCPGCGHKLQVKDELAGKRGKCPQCRQLVEVPAAAGAGPRSKAIPPSAAPQRQEDAPTLAPTGTGPSRSDAPTLPPPDRRSGLLSPKTGAPEAAATGFSADLYDFLAPPQDKGELGRLGDYRVLKILGAGGMGVVFLAEDTKLQRSVALKAMLPALAASASNRERFLREARAAANLDSDHVVTIHFVGEDRGVPYLAMPFLKGETLEDRLQRDKRVPMPEIVRIARETAEGLAAAHAKGLIHRDIKPANLFLEGDKARIKILDFGLARGHSDNAHLTQQGVIVGTPAYMAPEQAGGKQVDARADLFSLGCILYRLTTGELPFKGADTLSTLMAVASHYPPPADTIVSGMPPVLADLIRRMLRKQADQRPASAREVADALATIPAAQLSSVPVDVLPEVVLAPRPVRPLERNRYEEDRRRREPAVRVPVGDDGDDREEEEWARQSARKKMWMLLIAGGVVGLAALLVVLVLLLGRGNEPSTAVAHLPPPPPPPPPPPQFPFPVPPPVVPVPPPPTDTPPPPPPVTDLGPPKTGRRPPKTTRLVRPPSVLTHPDFQGDASTLALSADGKLLYVGLAAEHKWDTPSQVCVWDWKAGKIVSKLTKHNQAITAVALSPDGKRLASFTGKNPFAKPEGMLLKLGEDEAPIPLLHDKPVFQARFSSDGKWIATASEDHHLRVWDAESGAVLGVWKQEWDSSPCVAFSPDNKWVAMGADKRGEILILETSPKLKPKAVLQPGHDGTVRDIQFTPDGLRLISASEDKTVRVWDLKPVRVKYILPHSGKVNCVAVSPKGRYAASGDSDGMVKVWDLNKGRMVAEHFTDVCEVFGTIFTPDSKTVLASTSKGRVHVFKPDLPNEDE